MKLKMLSLFTGIGAFEKALKNIGIECEIVGFSEIDKYALLAYENHNIHFYVNKCKFHIVEYIREVE